MEVYNPAPGQIFTTLLDEVSSTVTYIGEALPGTGNGDAYWRIKKLDTSSGLSVTWAGGTVEQNKIWNDRATYIYS